MRRRLLTGAAIAILGAAGCGASTAADREREILVFAAASLTESFKEIGTAFRRSHAGVTVRFNFGPSDGLATGINEGAPADVFASASPRWMDVVASELGVTDRADFARSRLVVIVPEDDPASIRSIADLARPDVKLVLAAPSVPAGGYAREALDQAGLHGANRNVVSNEKDVKGVVQKVVLGEADAGIVYATDVTAAVEPSVRVVAIPDEFNVLATYQIAVVRGRGGRVETARDFVSFVLRDGRRILREAGFLPP